MPTYLHRCPIHGDFELERGMDETRRLEGCIKPTGRRIGDTDLPCCLPSPKVLSGHIHFKYGKDVFHDGPNGTGETVKETADRWVADARARGLDPEPSGYIHH